ncbi:MAG: hypothetical protein DRH79_07535 [Candidatus Cloacimonadota bacterium]|nr:MAG: hypothetical protein DRH79_07535 [Candidatus Cloacimonadota bacterium]
MNSNNEINKYKRTTSERIENTGWGLFLIMLGLIWLVPDGILPEGTFLIGTGIILLGLNYFRKSKGLKPSKFGIFLGLVALLSGVGDYSGMDISIFPVILILWGLSIIWKIISRKNKKNEEREYYE